MKLRDLADRLACTLEGDGDLEIDGVEGLERAGPRHLTFYANPRYTDALRRTRAGAVLLQDGAPEAPCAALRTPNPYLAFARAVSLFAPATAPPAGVDPRAVVADDAVVGADASIGPFVFVGREARIGRGAVVHPHAYIGPRATIGEGCVIHSHVAIREAVTLGRRVVVQNGAVIGSDGFGFAHQANGTHEKIPQIGTVVIEDDVEIGANTAIDRPALGETRIGAGTKIDNLVQIAHGVRVGQHVLLAAQVGIAGSTVVEDHVILAGQVGVAGHITLRKGMRATAQSGIPNSVDPGVLVSGYPAIENRDWLKASAIFRRLPELKRRVKELEARLDEVAARLAPSASEPGS